VEPVTQSRLKEIQVLFGDRCEIIGSYDKHSSGNSGKSNPTEILGLLERRAMTIDGLVNSQNASKDSIVDSLRALKEAGLIDSFLHQNEEHFRAKEVAKEQEPKKRVRSRASK
jgi:hypothetical protein